MSVSPLCFQQRAMAVPMLSLRLLVLLTSVLLELVAGSGSKFAAAPGCDRFHGERWKSAAPSRGVPIFNVTILESEPFRFVRMMIGEDTQGEIASIPDWKTMASAIMPRNR